LADFHWKAIVNAYKRMAMEVGVKRPRLPASWESSHMQRRFYSLAASVRLVGANCDGLIDALREFFNPGAMRTISLALPAGALQALRPPPLPDSCTL